MKTIISIFILGTLVSCASMNETVRGYPRESRHKLLTSIKDLSYQEIVAKLGKPVAEGTCETCSPHGPRYQMVYLTKDMPRYSYALTMANQSALECFFIELRKNEDGKYFFDGSTSMEQTSCATNTGIIRSVSKMGK